MPSPPNSNPNSNHSRSFTPHVGPEPPEPPHIEPGELFENDPERDRNLPKRRLARERVMQILYAHELSGRDLEELFWEFIERDLRDADERAGASEADGALDFARGLTREFLRYRTEIDELVSKKLERWDFRRVALIDRLLIEIGIVELLYFPEIPPKATINELIEIAKDFSTEESGKFINGLLHAFLTDLRESGALHKTGRGLIEESIGGHSSWKGRKR